MDSTWFEKRKHKPNTDPLLLSWMSQEVDALKAFHDGEKNADETAMTITRPISLSSVPELGGYADEIIATYGLWELFIEALDEWPTTRAEDIFGLLEAIGKVPDKIHLGEATDNTTGERQLQWADYPYFTFMWELMFWQTPGEICRDSRDDPASLPLKRQIYLRRKDLEAQLVSRGIMSLNFLRLQYIARTFEREIDEVDLRIAENESIAHNQIKLEFHLPAVASWFKYNASEINRRIIDENLRAWYDVKGFDHGCERWSFWKQRAAELTASQDYGVGGAAQACLRYMEEVDMT